MPAVEHEFIVVSRRRWCIGCSLFQLRDKGTEWPAADYCPRDTTYAREKDKPCQP